MQESSKQVIQSIFYEHKQHSGKYYNKHIILHYIFCLLYVLQR